MDAEHALPCQVRPKGARHDRAAAAAAGAAQAAEDAAFDRARRELVFEAKAAVRRFLVKQQRARELCMCRWRGWASALADSPSFTLTTHHVHNRSPMLGCVELATPTLLHRACQNRHLRYPGTNSRSRWS